MNKIELKKASVNELEELQLICKESYEKNFYNHWEKNGLEIYLEEQFGRKRLEAELVNESIEYNFIKFEKEVVGFTKIHFNKTIENSNESCELEKIYILPKWKGRGIGKEVLNQIIKQLKDKNKRNLFLCVIDTNIAAITFYEKIGFQYHSETRLEAKYFKEELRGMKRMLMGIN